MRSLQPVFVCLVGLLALGATRVVAGPPVEVVELFPIPSAYGVTGLVVHDGMLYAGIKGNMLMKCDPATGQQVEFVDPLLSGTQLMHLHGMARGPGDTFWLVETHARTVLQLSFDDYSVVSSIPAPPDGPPPFGLAYADQRLWVGHHSDGPPTAVEVVDAQTGEILQVHQFGAADVHGLAWVGDYLWVLDNTTDELLQIDAAGQVRDRFALPDDTWLSLFHDGTMFWANSRLAFYNLHVSPPLCPPPGEVDRVVFTGKNTLAWLEPVQLGGGAVVYDTLRSDVANDFMTVARCVESNDGNDLTATDSDVPAPATAYHYLVRAENTCPSGTGPLGNGSSGQAREGAICP